MRLSADARRSRRDEDAVITVLVCHASRHGATQGIAERIAARIDESGEAVAVRSVDTVHSLDGYAAVVFGAPVYHRSWPPEAEHFLGLHRDALASRPLWVFSVGSFGDTQPLLGRLVRREPTIIEEVRALLHPRDYRVFQGVIHEQQWRLVTRAAYRALGGRFGDQRDWPAIDAWGEEIARAVSTERFTTQV